MEKETFIEKMADILEIEEMESFGMDTAFRDLDEWSSLSGMEMITFFKEEMGKEVSVSDFKRQQTIGDLYALVCE